MGKQWLTLFWGGSKITADGDCSHEIKRRVLLGRKVMSNLDSIWKSRDITLSTKVCLVKAMVFPVVMYGCESWTVKKAECRIDAFELWCWKRLLRVPWTAKRPNQSILKEISPGCSLEGLMLKLKLQYFGHLMRRADSLEKTLMLGKTEGRWIRRWQRMRWLIGITDSMEMSLGNSRSWWWTGRPGMLRFMGSQRVRHDWATELKRNQSWIFIGRTDVEAEAPILWPPDAKYWLIGKDPDAGRDWRLEEKGTTEDEMAVLDGHEFEQALGVGDGQGSLVCCSSWGCRVRHNWATE